MGRKGPQDCVSCNARFYLYSDPTQNITQCVNSCNSGYYLDSNNKICKPCSSNCITCYSEYNCTQCNTQNTSPPFCDLRCN